MLEPSAEVNHYASIGKAFLDQPFGRTARPFFKIGGELNLLGPLVKGDDLPDGGRREDQGERKGEPQKRTNGITSH